MPASDDIKFIQRCLDLAGKAEGNTYPNPLVGAVIVHNGLIIGEGYHLKAGGPHAERIAIDSVADPGLLKKSTLFTNLEPCSHFGKTPPCSGLIISAGIKKVVIGTMDTTDKVSGRGIMDLKNAGCEVVTGILEKDCRWINRRFFTYHEKKRPYIILKWAQSRDGFLDIDRSKNQDQRPVWITGEPERVLVHKWRAAEQSILVGAGTVRADNPMLNVREWPGSNPLRLVLSSSGSLDKSSAVFKSGDKTVVFTHNAEAETGEATKVVLIRNKTSASQITDYLFNSGIQSVLIEGGAKVLSHFISSGLWDEARIFFGKDIYKSGIRAPEAKGKIISYSKFTLSSLEVILNNDSQALQGIDNYNKYL
jgi:diaminohydroxyphosphoribosylaminopyrimidine deaminase/5-amino-6-(5-phosphoribosylamino)uracil reductase